MEAPAPSESQTGHPILSGPHEAAEEECTHISSFPSARRAPAAAPCRVDALLLDLGPAR
jgi:hypothetical protein